MAVSPIDLQTMFSQVENVAKQASHLQQGVKLAEEMQQINVIRQNAEKAQKVNSSNESSKSDSVNDDSGSSKKFNQNQSNNSESSSSDSSDFQGKNRLKESYLGNHIDITR